MLIFSLSTNKKNFLLYSYNRDYCDSFYFSILLFYNKNRLESRFVLWSVYELEVYGDLSPLTSANTRPFSGTR